MMREPVTRLSHCAAALAARVGLLVWMGDAVQLYSAGQPGGARSDPPLY